jgi:hypothetical protein
MMIAKTNSLFVVLLSLASLTTKAFGLDCSICPEGSTIEDSSAAFLGDGGATCGVLESSANILTADSAECENYVTNLVNAQFAFSAFCCSGVEPPGTCSLCGEGGTITDENTSVLGLDDGTTCGDISNFALHLVNTTLCSEYTQLAPLCCDNADSSCNICPDGSPIGTPEKQVYLDSNETLTCANIQVFLNLAVESEDECAEATGPDAEYSFAFYCGCEGVDAPDVCSLCADDEQLKDPDMEVPGFYGATCANLADLVRGANNQTVCDADVADIKAICDCEAKPTDDSFFVSMTAAALFMMGTTLVMLLA